MPTSLRNADMSAQGVDFLSIHTDRDHWRCVFLTDLKKYFATDRRPKKNFLKSRTLKIPSSDMIYLVNVKHNMITKKNCAH